MTIFRCQTCYDTHVIEFGNRDIPCPNCSLPPADKVSDALQGVLYAWAVEGPRPDIHRLAKARLYAEWPRLAQALQVLESTLDNRNGQRVG